MSAHRIHPCGQLDLLGRAEAVASYDGARIAAHSYGGSGINIYDRIFLNVLWPDLTIDFLGEYTAEEMQLPNYIPPSPQPMRIAS
jgi:hypothetical protein